MNGREPVDPNRHFRLDPDGGWEDVHAQYRRLVQRWHPDRHPPETRAEAQAEFIEIVAAFKGLRRHYGEHGRLPRRDPPAPALSSDPAATDPGPAPRTLDRRARRLRAVLRAPSSAVAAALALALSLAALVLLLDERLERERRDQALSRSVESGERTLRRE